MIVNFPDKTNQRIQWRASGREMANDALFGALELNALERDQLAAKFAGYVVDDLADPEAVPHEYLTGLMSYLFEFLPSGKSEPVSPELLALLAAKEPQQ